MTLNSIQFFGGPYSNESQQKLKEVHIALNQMPINDSLAIGSSDWDQITTHSQNFQKIELDFSRIET